MTLNEFFRDLFEYHHHYNQRLIDLLIANEWQLSERTVPLYSHLINAHQIWNSRIIGGDPFGVNDVHSLVECKSLDAINYKNSIRILQEKEIDQGVHYQNSRGDQYENIIREMLFQVINHTTHHRGQIISDLRLSGVAPPVTDYIFYKR